LWNVQDPTFFRQSAHRWRLNCQPYVLAAFYLQKDLLVLISVRGWINTRAMVRLVGVGKLRKSKDFIANWTRDLPTCNIVLQPTRLHQTSLPLTGITWL
jgi:hypothetical protein